MSYVSPESVAQSVTIITIWVSGPRPALPPFQSSIQSLLLCETNIWLYKRTIKTYKPSVRVYTTTSLRRH